MIVYNNPSMIVQSNLVQIQDKLITTFLRQNFIQASDNQWLRQKQEYLTEGYFYILSQPVIMFFQTYKYKNVKIIFSTGKVDKRQQINIGSFLMYGLKIKLFQKLN